MSKFIAKLSRTFEVDIEADDLKTADALAKKLIKQFPEHTATLLELREIPPSEVA